MTMLSIWREQLKRDLATFAPLVNEDRSINLIYGITAAAVLWSVRAAPVDDVQRAALLEVCGNEKHMPHLLEVLAEWHGVSPLDAACKLSSRRRESEELGQALTVVMSYFIEELLTEKMVQTQSITVEGNITGGNIVIGGHQIVAGDLIIRHITAKAERLCPAPLPEPEKFGGRDVRLHEIMELIKAGDDTAITAVYGMGGIGKTTLARVLAHRLHADKTFRAVLWADITRNPNVINILSGWVVSYADSSFEVARFNGDLGQIADAVRVQLNNVIAEKCETCDPPRVLVVLDDVWDNGRDTARLIKRACPDHATLLITTRSENVAIDLEANAQSLAYLSPNEAIDFLKTYLVGFDEGNLRQLGKALGGHALALKLAARRILKEKRPGESDTAKLVRLISEYEHGVPAGSSFAQLKLEQGEEKEDNLTRSLYQSYDVLTQVEQKRFRALGILAYDAPFSAEMLSALWELPLEQVYEAADALRLLSLLDIDNDGYKQHPLLRAYAHALLEEQDETSTAFGRYTDYVIAHAEQFNTLPPEQWEQLEPLLPHVEAVGDTLVERYAMMDTLNEALPARMSDFAYNISNYVLRRPHGISTPEGTRLRGMNWLEGGRSASRLLQDKRREAFFLNHLALEWSAIGEKYKALEFSQQALPLFRATGDWHGEATAFNNIGSAWTSLGEKRKAIEFFERAQSVLHAIGDRAGEATTLSNIGSAWSALGQKRKALEFFQRALSVGPVSDKRRKAITLINIGRAWDDLGEKLKALEFFNHALPLFRAVGDRRNEATTLNNIGATWDDLNETRKALMFYEQALPISHAVGDRGGEATTLNNIGLIWNTFGEQHKALKFYELALPLFRAIGNRGGEAATLANIGLVWSALGDQRTALDFYEQSLILRQAIEDRNGEAATLNNIGAAWSALGDKRRALEFYDRALVLRRAVEDLLGEGITLLSIGGIWCELGEFHNALKFLSDALHLFHNVGDRNNEALTCLTIGLAFHALGDLEQAIEYIERCVTLEEQTHNADVNRNREVLVHLKAMRDVVPAEQESQENQASAVMRQLSQLYAEKGDSAVREMLAGQVDEVMIEQVIRIIQQNSGE